MLAYNIMAPEIDIVPAIGAHIGLLKNNLRAEDEAEIVGFGVTAQQALWYSYKHSLIRKTAFINAELAACWGVVGVALGGKGQVWLMTTPEVKKVSPLMFVRIYQTEVLEMLKIFQRLENYVDAEYAAAIRLLEIIGFTVEEPQKMGNGMYRHFWMER